KGKTIYTWCTHSNIWTQKKYVLEQEGNTARYFIRVEGKGAVESIRFWGDGARYEAAGYLLPVASHGDYNRNLRMSTEAGVIELGYFTPPCYCYPFYMADCEGWLGVGLAAKEGQYNFHQFQYCNENNDNCAFEVPLYGQTLVDGVWESQSLLFVEGKDAYTVIKAYADWHYESGWCRRAQRTQTPNWWKRPIFCGWGEQAALAKRQGAGKQTDYARQQDYEYMMKQLDEYQLNPGTVIIDDQWQDAYGTSLPDQSKWPDMRGFVDGQHAKGR
ncbi:MAG: hypothetical protein RR482_10595, partial [Clostridia bacterium]